MNTRWHDVRERKPAEGSRVMVIRKAFFWDAYYPDFAVFRDGRFHCGSATPNVIYWSESPEMPEEKIPVPVCRYCGQVMVRKETRYEVDEERYLDLAWYECPTCGSKSPEAAADKALRIACE